jgi:hypothetical protein
MKMLISEEDFKQNYKWDTLVPLECCWCGNSFFKGANEIRTIRKNSTNHGRFCSHKCQGLSTTTKVEIPCAHCAQLVFKFPADIQRSKTKRFFCSRNCAAIYNNTHKTTGTRVSKLEVWLHQQLLLMYPKLEFLFNDKQTINSELDIYIPSLKLAFELNGIFHYEPIFGPDKLSSIQNNDSRKFQACLENGIALAIIDSSGFKRFKESEAIKYLTIISSIIDKTQHPLC